MTRFHTPRAAARLLLAGLLAATGALAQDAPREPGATLGSLIAFARANNPEYASMQHEADAAAQRVYPAGALPDPVIRAELQNITNAGSDARPSVWPGRVGSTRYLLMQPVPFPGKRDLKREVAQAESEGARERAALTWTEIVAKIKAEHAQHYYVSHSLRLTAEILDLMSRLEQVAQSRYASGLVPQQDVIRAQIEQTGIRTELVGMDAELRQIRARLNGLLARPATAPLATPEALAPLPAPAALDPAALADRVRARNPQLASEEARLRAAGKNRDLTLRNRYPDFVFGVAPMQAGSRIEQWELMLELNIPLQQESRRAQEREAEAMLSAARLRRDAAANQLLAELSASVEALDAARRTEQLAASSLLPQARLTLQSALAAYENGRVDFATLLDAQRQIRKARQDGLKAQADARMRLAEIERLIGEDL